MVLAIKNFPFPIKNEDMNNQNPDVDLFSGTLEGK
jgi:hypothetical protein